MAKKMILLMLALPLILMIALFTTTQRVSLAVDIAVSGVEFTEPEILYLDYDSTYNLNYAVYPTNAKNKDVSFKVEEVDKDTLFCDVSVDETGKLNANKVGNAKVTITTKDGGFSDSMIISINSNKLVEIKPEIENTTLYVGDTSYIKTTFIPSDVSDDTLKYESNNPSVCQVFSDGKVKANSKGTANIKVIPLANESLYETITINVLNSDILDLSDSLISTWLSESEIKLSVDTTEKYQLEFNTYDINNNKIDVLDFNLLDNILKFKFKDPNYKGNVILKVKIITESNHVLEKECLISKKNVNEIDFNFTESEKIISLNTNVSSVFFNLNVTNAPISYEVSASNDAIGNFKQVENVIRFDVLKGGVSTLKVKGIIESRVIEREITIIIKPKSMLLPSNEVGLEKLLTIGKYNADNSIYKHKLDLSINGNVTSDFMNYITFETSNQNVKVDKNGLISINGNINEIVSVKAKFTYNDKVISETNSIQIRMISDGYNVSNYKDLLSVIKNKNIVVLKANIRDDFGYIDGVYNPFYEEIYSTYDCDYYLNLNKPKPKIKILLKIENDIYGNGYMINAHNVTYQIDSTQTLNPNSLFKGPLDFVRAVKVEENPNSKNEPSLAAAAVKGQDNVVFALLDNVSLHNVELKGCDDVIDLTDLNYVGTTVETFGDNININYSRLNNGRVVLRTFGDIVDVNKKVHVNVSNSVLSKAREFIIRTGSNKTVQGTKDVPSMLLPNDNLNLSFPRQIHYEKMNDVSKNDYEEKFINTFVHLTDVALRECGIFTIGLDSHFSGPALNGAISGFENLLTGWERLAKTSYGVKLTLSEDVRLYDWKRLDSVDSSTLIETQGHDETFKKLEFNINELVDHISTLPGFSDILTNYGEENGKAIKYVHGGIAYFGGGKNYSVVSFDKNFNNEFKLNNYQVTLSDANKAFLEVAAGTEPFYFMLYDNRTTNFLPKDQEMLFASGSPYDFIYE